MRSNRSKAGFTLVELLVVIGIIAVLISILLPSLARARQAALNVQCASNMRQIGLGFQFYTDANKGFLPPSRFAGTGTMWWDVVAPNIGVTLNQAGGTAFNCPVATFDGGVTQYGVHPRLCPNLDAWHWDCYTNSNMEGYKVVRVKRSTEVVLLMEAPVMSFDGDWPSHNGSVWELFSLDSNRIFWGDPTWGGSQFIENTSNGLDDPIGVNGSGSVDANRDLTNGWGDMGAGVCQIRWRHNKQNAANFLFVDGHVEMFTAKTNAAGFVVDGGQLKQRNLWTTP